tara:strand:+ start:803 stop:1564 length:762 start_codon:yes stop_codon:yes gene_type:complete
MKILNFYIILFSILLGSDEISCDICKLAINNNYFKDAWGNKYHSYHKKDAHFCNTCSRIISVRLTRGGFQFNDGRYMCKLCETSIIKTKEQRLNSMDFVVNLLNKKGIDISLDGIEVSLVDKKTLEESIIHLSNHNKETVKGITILNNNKYRINILWGLTELEFKSVLAHELLHVWVDYNNIRLNEGKLEGLCNLGSALVYKYDNSQLSKILLESMKNNNDPIYGKGYKYMDSMLEIHGWESLISILLKNNQN